MAGATQLYDVDFLRWSQEQAGALREAARSGANLPLDWENLAEEIESLGRQQRTELRTRIGTIVEHLMKLEASPARNPRRGWEATVRRTRLEVQRLLKVNPSLKPELSGVLEEERADIAALVAADLAVRRELTDAVRAKLAALRYSEPEILGDWLPASEGRRDTPARPSRRPPSRRGE